MSVSDLDSEEQNWMSWKSDLSDSRGVRLCATFRPEFGRLFTAYATYVNSRYTVERITTLAWFSPSMNISSYSSFGSPIAYRLIFCVLKIKWFPERYGNAANQLTSQNIQEISSELVVLLDLSVNCSGYYYQLTTCNDFASVYVQSTRYIAIKSYIVHVSPILFWFFRHCCCACRWLFFDFFDSAVVPTDDCILIF